jgi:hypothetical protein
MASMRRTNDWAGRIRCSMVRITRGALSIHSCAGVHTMSIAPATATATTISSTTALRPRGMRTRRNASTTPESTSAISTPSASGTRASRPRRIMQISAQAARIHSGTASARSARTLGRRNCV